MKNSGMAAGGPVAFFKHDGTDEEENAVYEKYKAHYSYMNIENRLGHIDSETDILVDMGLSDDITIGIAVEMQERLYKLLYGAYACHPKDMLEKQSWEDCCKTIYEKNLAMWDEPKLKKLCKGDMHSKIKQVLKKYYEAHLEDRPC